MTTNQFAGRDVINAGGDVNINNNVYPIVRVHNVYMNKKEKKTKI